MNRSAVFACACILVLLAVISVWAAEPDPDVLAQGEDAIRAEDWEDAREAFVEALKTEPRHVAARCGLARALLGAGSTREGIDELRRAVRWGEAEDTRPDAWTDALLGARSELRDIDPPSEKLEVLLAGAVKDLLKYGKAKRKRAQVEATCALRLASRLDPRNEAAAACLSELKALPPGIWVSVCPSSGAGWTGIHAPQWNQRGDGILECVSGDKAYVCKTKLSVHGDFDMRVQFRILKKNSPTYGVGLQGGWRGEHDYMWLGVGESWVTAKDRRAKGVNPTIRLNVPVEDFYPNIDPSQFNTFELRFRGSKLLVYVNDTLVLTTRRGAHRHCGHMGLLCARATAEFRNMEIRQH